MDKLPSQHLLLKIENLDKGFDQKTIKTSLFLPPKTIPKPFISEDVEGICFGFYLVYDRQINNSDLLKLCKSGQWVNLAHFVGNFLIVYINFKSQELYALSDIFGTFPCYFSIQNHHLLFSTDFGLISKNLEKKSLNISSALDYLYSNYLSNPTNETIIKEINQVPPGTLLKIDRFGETTLNPLQNLDAFIEYKSSSYTNVNDFINDFLTLLDKVTKQRIKSININRIAVDLSSGFDCTLVAYILSRMQDIDLHCYSRVSKYAYGDTEPGVMGEFANQHHLKLNILNMDDIFPFNNGHDLEWTKQHFFPADHGQEMYYQFSKKISEDNFKIRFTGDGGDEIYHSASIGKLGRYPIQTEYFFFVQGLKFDIDCFFTQKGIEQLLDRKRFAKKKFFPTYTSQSSTAVGLLFFPIIWELDLWNMSPLTDPRLIQFARRIPMKNNRLLSREELWATRPDIFVRSQFRPKGHFGGHVSQFLKNHPDFVISVLNNSVLGKMGIIKNEEIIDKIKKGQIAKYLDKPLLILHNILRLEYFLQQNHKIAN